MDTPSLETTKATALLKNRSFRLLWIAQFSAVTVIYGLSLAGVAWIEERTHSSAQTGLVILSAILPAFLGSLIAGPVVDRWGKKRALVISHLARALVALAFWAGTGSLAPTLALLTIYTASAVMAIFSQFAMTAELSMLPDLIDGSQLMSANSLLQVSILVAEGLGIIALSPLTIKLSGVPAVGLIGVFLCLLSFTLALALPGDRPAPRAEKSSQSSLAELGTDLKAGWQTIAKDRLLVLVAIQATIAATLLLVVVALLPGLASRHLGLGVEDVPLLFLPGGLGFVLGTILIGRLDQWLSRPHWIAFGLVGLGLGIGGLALSSGEAIPLWLNAVVIFAIGLTLAFVIIPARTVLQERPPAEMRGRVISAQLALANAAAVLPLLLGGSLADRVGILPVLGVLGLTALVTGTIGLYYARRET